MSDSEEEVVNVSTERPNSSLLNRSKTPELDEKDVAEKSHLSAGIKEAEEFELTFEIVEKSADENEEEGEVFRKDEEIEKILSPAPSSKERKSVRIVQPEELENDENVPPPRKKLVAKRKSIIDELKAEFESSPSEKKKLFGERRTPLSEKRGTPKSSKTTH